MKSCYVRIEGSEDLLKVQVPDDVRCGEYVLLELQRGLVPGKIVTEPKEEEKNLPKIKKKIEEEEMKKYLELKKKEIIAHEFCKKKIEEMKLPMKLLKTEYLWEGIKLIFYFFSEERVDFRSLVRELAKEFKVRIEMRQVGVRDEVRFLGGIGNCGDVVCCKKFLKNFTSVSIKMLKEQDLMLNPSKVSGICGRLMCCISYEYPVYCEMKKELPSVGRKIETSCGKGRVTKIDVIRKTITVKLEGGEELTLSVNEIEEGGEGGRT